MTRAMVGRALTRLLRSHVAFGPLVRTLFSFVWRLLGVIKGVKMAVSGAQKTISAEVGQWAGVRTAPHRFGGVEYLLGKREIGHIHGDVLVDIPFPKRVRDELVAAGSAAPHHILPASGWISFYIREPEDVDHAIGLLRRSYQIAIEQAARRQPKKETTHDTEPLPPQRPAL